MRTSRLTIAKVATANPMGAEVYQANIEQRARASLQQADGRDWTVHVRPFTALRQRGSAGVRLPLGRLAQASERTRAAVGRALHSSTGVTHRMNLEIPPASGRDVITLHDVIAWRYSDEAPPVPAAAAEARRAAAVICVSQYSAMEAVDLLGVESPFVVPNGVDERFFNALPLTEANRRELGLPREYVLHMGGATRRKNLEALSDAWELTHHRLPGVGLVLAGPVHVRRTELFTGMPGTKLLGRVRDDLMPGLIASARAVVVPSLCEGFGLPALEAMAAGTPVVAANTSALPEVLGDAGILVTPTGRDIAEGLLSLLTDARGAAKLVDEAKTRASKFTWERAAIEHARVWATVA